MAPPSLTFSKAKADLDHCLLGDSSPAAHRPVTPTLHPTRPAPSPRHLGQNVAQSRAILPSARPPAVPLLPRLLLPLDPGSAGPQLCLY